MWCKFYWFYKNDDNDDDSDDDDRWWLWEWRLKYVLIGRS